jgi:anti-sigma factor RsiW
MKCSVMQKRISAYLDGEIPEEERKTISEHLERCEDCRTEFAGLSRLMDALNTYEGIEVPSYFVVRLKAHVREHARQVTLPLRIRSMVFSAATALAVVASLFAGSHMGRSLYQALAQTAEPTLAETSSVLGLDAFEEFPDNSLSDIYNELISGGNNG